MRAYILAFSVLVMFAAGCGKDKDDSEGDTAAASEDSAAKDKADEGDKSPKEKKGPGSKDESDDADAKPTKDPKKKADKKPDPATDKSKPAAGQHCEATFEDGYWKVWATGETKPSLPSSAPKSCTSDTPTDLTGGSMNGKPAGSQRVLLKTAEGCYVPNGGGPVGPLLGACTGVTWRVPY